MTWNEVVARHFSLKKKYKRPAAMHAGRNHQGRMQAAKMTMRMPHMIKNHCIVYRLVWLLQGNGAVKREQRELVHICQAWASSPLSMAKIQKIGHNAKFIMTFFWQPEGPSPCSTRTGLTTKGNNTTSTFNEERQKNCRSSSENPKTITGWEWGG